jgi:hypothetical protein
MLVPAPSVAGIGLRFGPGRTYDEALHESHEGAWGGGRMRRIGIVAVLVSWALGVAAVHAAVFCEKKSGAVAIRDACKKKETPVNLADFGAVGPKGDAGSPGTPGTPGTPGAAVAYAHVLANGTVDAANSKNVTSANVTLDNGGIVPVFCFHDLSFSFHSAVAVVAWGGVGSVGQLAQVGLGDPAGDCISEVGVQLVVVTQTSSTVVAEEFFVVFN